VSVAGKPVAERANPSPKLSACPALSLPAADVKPARDKKRNTTGNAHRGNFIAYLLAFAFAEEEDRLLDHILISAGLGYLFFERGVTARGHSWS
jgi:hypothetical protein